MLKSMVEMALRQRVVVVMLAAILLVYGTRVALTAPVDVFPEFAPPTVTVQTEAPGLPPEDVELLVARPLENAIDGTLGLRTLRSESIQGFAVVHAVFSDDTDVLVARRDVAERIAQAVALFPDGVDAPVIAPLTSSTSLVLALGLTGRGADAMALRDLAAWTMRPRLLAVPGVASVVIFGGEERQLQVSVDPTRLAAAELVLADVEDAVRAAIGVAGPGFVETAGQRITVRAGAARPDPAAIGKALLGGGGPVPLHVSDVAEVEFGAAPAPGDAVIGAEPGVLLLVWGRYGSNTLAVTREVESALDSLETEITTRGAELHRGLFRPADFIETSIGNVWESLALGGLLVAVVLFLFLANLRTAAISLLAIPLSLLSALVVLRHFGASLNTMTLGGFAIAIGVVVDDAIVDVENIVRRLRDRRAAGDEAPAARIVLEASLEVRGAVVHATLLVALVLLPVLGLPGVEGSFFHPLAWAFLLATLASLIVALTVTPALCLMLLGGRSLPARPRLLDRLQGAHRAVLAHLLRHPRATAAFAFAVVASALVLLPLLRTGFLPDFREGHEIVWMRALPGTSARESARLARLVAADLLQDPRVASVSCQIGRAELGEDTEGTDFSEFIVTLKPMPGDELAAMEDLLRERLARFPGLSFGVQTFLAERVAETVSGEAAAFAVRLHGQDLEALDRAAARVADALARVPGAEDVAVPSPPREPQLSVVPRRGDLARLGFKPAEVLDAVEAAVAGRGVGRLVDGERLVDVVVRLAPPGGAKSVGDPERLAALVVPGPGGRAMRLSELADVGLTEGRHAVLHDGLRRSQVVTCGIANRDLDDFAADVTLSLASLGLPPGIESSLEGAAAGSRDLREALLVNSSLAAAGIVLLLFVVFHRPRPVALVLVNLPFALVGGVAAAALAGGSLTVGSLVGFVTLFGITARNAILLVAHWEHLVRIEGRAWDADTALAGAVERLAPILMTALVTGLGLLPLALAGHEPGREVEGPMAIVILGGLVTSTALNLLVLPCLAARWLRLGGSAGD